MAGSRVALEMSSLSNSERTPCAFIRLTSRMMAESDARSDSYMARNLRSSMPSSMYLRARSTCLLEHGALQRAVGYTGRHRAIGGDGGGAAAAAARRARVTARRPRAAGGGGTVAAAASASQRGDGSEGEDSTQPLHQAGTIRPYNQAGGC